MEIIHKNKYNVLSTLTKYSFVMVIAFALILPAFTANACGKPGEPECPPAGADTHNNGNPKAGADTNTKTNNTAAGTKISTGLGNPLENAGIDDITSFIESILRFVIMIGIPIVTLAIIYSGFLFVVARGNPEELKKAKKTFLYTLVGAALLLGSYVIANAIQGTVNEITNNT